MLREHVKQGIYVLFSLKTDIPSFLSLLVTVVWSSA